jgi:hypothetical protein
MDDLICWSCGWQGIDVTIVDGAQICVVCLVDIEVDRDNILDELIEFWWRRLKCLRITKHARRN